MRNEDNFIIGIAPKNNWLASILSEMLNRQVVISLKDLSGWMAKSVGQDHFWELYRADEFNRMKDHIWGECSHS